MSRPFVSIVIPTYDRAGMVETAVMSVLDQDYERLEAIVLDDGSHDETPAVLERIAQRSDPARFRWARHDNVGQAATINRGLAQARGELLGYLSSDDYLLPGAIETLVAAAEAHPDGDVFYPWFSIVDGDDREIDMFESLDHTFVDALRWAICLPGVGALVRRRLYERIGGWDESYRTCPDYEWWLRAGDARFVRVPATLGVWRAHDGSISVSGSGGPEQLRERLRLLEATFARPDLPEEVRAIEREAYASTLIHTATGLMAGTLGDAGQRFAVEDRLGPLYSRAARAKAEEHRLELLHALRSAEHQLDRGMARVAELQQELTARDDAACEREQRIAELEAERATLLARIPPAETHRPPWLRAARSLTPGPLRLRVGAAVHRLRGGSR